MHMNGGRLQKSFSEHTAHEAGLQQLQTPPGGTHSAENRKLRLRFTGSARLTPDVETWQHSGGRIRTWREREFLDHPALCQLLTAWGSTTCTQANTQQESPARVAVRPTNTPSSSTDTHGGCVNFSHRQFSVWSHTDDGVVGFQVWLVSSGRWRQRGSTRRFSSFS